MKTNYKTKSLLSAAVVISVFYGCSKSNSVKPAGPAELDVSQQSTLKLTADGKHSYGLLPTSKEEYDLVPTYTKELFRSKFHEMGRALATAQPAVVTISNPAVRDQGQLGSCTSFSGSEAYEIAYYYKTGAYPAIVSPAFLYYQERVHILGEKISADNGANMVNIDQALTKYGITSEALMPYPSSDKSTAYKTPPTAAAISYALNYKISSYTLINTGDTAAVKNCLRNNISVMFGFNVYDNSQYTIFEGLTSSSDTYSPLTSAGKLKSGLSLLGGHANTIIGYDDTKKAFLVQNSWGTSWGNAGFYYLPYAVFSSTKIVPQGGVYYLAI